MRLALLEQGGEPGGIVQRRRDRRDDRRRGLGLAQLPADFLAQRQQPGMIGRLLQALLDLQQADLVGAISLVTERPAQELVGFAPALLGLGFLPLRRLDFLPLGFGSLPLGEFGLMAGDVLLALAFRPFGQNRLLQGPQIRVVGHGLQALFDVDQAHVERAFLPGALGLFQELFGLQLGLSGLVLVGDLAVHLVAQRQQDGMVGHELQPLLDAGQAVRQSARLLVSDRLRQQLVGLGLALGGQVDGGRFRRPGRRRNGQRRSRWRRGRRPIQEQIAARDHRAGQGRRQGDSDFPAEPACGSRGVARGRHQSFPRAGQAGGRFDGIQSGDDFLAVLKPLVGVFVQQLVQQRLKASQLGRQLRDGSGHMHHRQGKAVFGGVGHVAGQHLVEQHAEAVQVGAGIHRLAANLLRAHVARRADGQAGPGHDRGAAEGFGDAEVGQHRAAVFAEQDVLGLDVAVDDVAAVGVVQGAGHGAGDGQASCSGKPSRMRCCSVPPGKYSIDR